MKIGEVCAPTRSVMTRTAATTSVTHSLLRDLHPVTKEACATATAMGGAKATVAHRYDVGK